MASRGSYPMYHVYMLELQDGSYYVGHTNDLRRRVQEHQNAIACFHTKKIPMKRLLWTEEHPDRSSASIREKEVKGWRREKKERLFQISSLP